MSPDADAILNAALNLSEGERLAIADRLLASLPDEPPGQSIDDPDFFAELKRRSADPAPGMTWSEIRSRL